MKWRSLDECPATVDTRPLREQLNERRQLIAKYVPPEAQAIHAQAIAEVGASLKPLRVGDPAPAFELQDHNGTTVSSAELLRKSPLVICFFRGRWCPFCVGQMEAMNAILPRVRQAGATIVGMSPQTLQQSFFMADQHKLQFSLLSDGHNKIARRFGLAYVVPGSQQSVYRRALVNLPFINGDDSWELPAPATFIVDREGVIRYVSANADYTERAEPADLLEGIINLR